MVGAYAYYEFFVVARTPGARLRSPCRWCVGAVVGALTHIVVLRPMRKSSRLTRVIATLGVLIVLQSAAVLRYGVEVGVPSSLPTSSVEFIDGRAGRRSTGCCCS